MDDQIITPSLGRDVYLAPTACVAGAVSLGDECTVMPYVVIRGDVSSIQIGHRVNIQDASVVHTRKGVPLDIGDEVTIGHRAVVHCKRIGARSLIGIGAIVLDDAEIGPGCLVAAGAVVRPGTVVPAGKLIVGVPARVVRDVTDEERAYMERVVAEYVSLGRAHAEGRYPPVATRPARP